MVTQTWEWVKYRGNESISELKSIVLLWKVALTQASGTHCVWCGDEQACHQSLEVHLEGNWVDDKVKHIILKTEDHPFVIRNTFINAFFTLKYISCTNARPMMSVLALHLTTSTNGLVQYSQQKKTLVTLNVNRDVGDIQVKVRKAKKKLKIFRWRVRG